MTITQNLSDFYIHRTRSAYVWTRVLNTPFWALYSMLPFILYKDLHATAWQIACITSLKPMVSLFSLYWSSLVKRRHDRLLPNIMWAGFFSHLPFFFCPFISNPWYYIFASGIYMLFSRGMGPAWMEILKINVPAESRQKVFAYASALYHIGGAILPLGMGWILNDYYHAWRWLFPFTALISLFAVVFQAVLPIRKQLQEQVAPALPFSFVNHFKKPWQEALELLRQRPDFLRFQIGFMLAGGGLMLWQPALPIFFVDILNLSYKELTIALTLCKGVGYTLSMPMWTQGMNRIDIFRFTSIMFVIAALFPTGLIASEWNIAWLFAAYLLYGIMLAGSDLSWNLSGPIFAQHEDSSTFSGINVVSVGIRGSIAPALGGLLCSQFGAPVTLGMGGGLCLLAAWQFYASRTQLKAQPTLLSSS